MKKLIPAILLTHLMLHPPGAAAELAAAQKSAICQARSTCMIGKAYDAGKSETGAALSIVEVHLGLADKPEDAPDGGCRAEDTSDGGVEYWLFDGSAPPKRILKLCNDGYGAAGVDEDKVTVGPNRLVHWQVGGSAWRWESTVAFTLSPWRAVSERDCSFNVLSSNNGTVTDIDYLTMRARSIAKDAAGKWGEEVGCPDWPQGAARHFTPEPAPGLLGAYNILIPVVGAGEEAPKLPRGAAIGDCVPAMTTAGRNGFVVFGRPAPAGHSAEIRAVAESLNSLVIQVFDPIAAAPAAAPHSWVDLPHVEIWIRHNAESVRTRLPLADLAQTAVDLTGKAYAGVGRKGALPSVERWPARDAAGHPVIVMRLAWPEETAFLYGVALVYSQAEAGKQARLVATTGIVNNRPLYLPDITSLPNGNVEPRPGRCHIRDGRLSRGA